MNTKKVSSLKKLSSFELPQTKLATITGGEREFDVSIPDDAAEHIAYQGIIVTSTTNNI